MHASSRKRWRRRCATRCRSDAPAKASMRGLGVVGVSSGCAESVCDYESRVEIVGRLANELATEAGVCSGRVVRVRVDLLPRPAGRGSVTWAGPLGRGSAKSPIPLVASRSSRELKTSWFYEFGSCPSYKVPNVVSIGTGPPARDQQRAAHGALQSCSAAVRGATRALLPVSTACECIRLRSAMYTRSPGYAAVARKV